MRNAWGSWSPVSRTCSISSGAPEQQLPISCSKSIGFATAQSSGFHQMKMHLQIVIASHVNEFCASISCCQHLYRDWLLKMMARALLLTHVCCNTGQSTACRLLTVSACLSSLGPCQGGTTNVQLLTRNGKAWKLRQAKSSWVRSWNISLSQN